MTFTNPAAQKSIEVGQGLLKHLVLVGGFFGVCALYIYEVVQRNPGASFHLLEQFGPSFILGGAAIMGVYRLLDKVGGGMTQQMARMADGVAALAAKDDRQAEEMQLIAQFNAQNSERMLVVLREHGNKLQAISDRLDHMGAK